VRRSRRAITHIASRIGTSWKSSPANKNGAGIGWPFVRLGWYPAIRKTRYAMPASIAPVPPATSRNSSTRRIACHRESRAGSGALTLRDVEANGQLAHARTEFLDATARFDVAERLADDAADLARVVFAEAA